MKNNKLLFTSKSSDIRIITIYFFCLFFFIYKSILMEKITWLVFFLIALISVLYSTLKIRSIKFFSEKIEISNLITNKNYETIIWEDIKIIKIVYFSDTQFRDKDIYLELKNSSIIKLNILYVLMEDFYNLVLKDKEIPIYIKKNGKFIRYEPPKYV